MFHWYDVPSTVTLHTTVLCADAKPLLQGSPAPSDTRAACSYKFLNHVAPQGQLLLSLPQQYPPSNNRPISAIIIAYNCSEYCIFNRYYMYVPGTTTVVCVLTSFWEMCISPFLLNLLPVFPAHLPAMEWTLLYYPSQPPCRVSDTMPRQ